MTAQPSEEALEEVSMAKWQNQVTRATKVDLAT